jgi:acetylornithine deacetylase/succinyl-diaminopimelate desuccinylase-like protein
MVVFGPGTYEVAHATDEYVEVAELAATHAILVQFMEEILLRG